MLSPIVIAPAAARGLLTNSTFPAPYRMSGFLTRDGATAWPISPASVPRPPYASPMTLFGKFQTSPARARTPAGFKPESPPCRLSFGALSRATRSRRLSNDPLQTKFVHDKSGIAGYDRQEQIKNIA